MNRFLTLSMTSALVVASIAGAASAADHAHEIGAGAHERDFGISSHDAGALPTPPSGPEVGFGPAPHPVGYAQTSASLQDRLIRQWRGGRVDVVPLRNLGDTSMRASLEHRRANEPAHIAAVESAIERNHRLASRLEARNVSIGNVVDARTARDGNITLYVR